MGSLNVNNQSAGASSKMRTTGVVSWFNDGRGFGFISRDDVREDIFVHFSALQGDGYKSLTQGERVEFDVALGRDRRPQAENVVRL
jgi:cold shock protein